MGDALHSAANAAALLAERLPCFGLRRASSRIAKKSGSQAELFISILLSVVIMTGGLQIAVSAVRDLSGGSPEAPDPSALIAVIVSLAINEAVFRYQYRQSRKNGDHRYKNQSENYRFGLYSSLTVTIGVCLSMVGAYYSMQALLYMDSVAALIVSGLVIRKGYTLISRSVYGKPVEQTRHEQCADYFDTIQRVHGVITIEDLKVQDSGYISQVILEVKVSVNPRITVGEAHEIADRIQKLLLHRFIHVAGAHIIVVPYEPGYPYKSNFDLMDNDLPTIPQ